MANKVDAKLTDLGNQRTAKVKEIKDLKAKLRPSGISDAKRKSINNEINKLNGEREKLESDYKQYKSAAKTAKDYIKFNNELKELRDSITRAEARGEDATFYKDRKATVLELVKEISPEVESVFPEIIVNPETGSSVKISAKTEDTATSAAALGLPASSLTRESTVAEKAAKIAADEKGQVPPKGSGKSKGKETPALTDAQERDAALAAAAANKDFSLPETLFNNVDELTELLDDYVKSDKNGGQWTLDTFRQKFRNTNWYKNNSVEIKNRYVQLYNYNDQKKGGQDVSNTDYAKQISTLERQIADKARRIGSGIASDPDALRKAAENFYITNVGIDDAMATDLIAAAIRPIGGTIGGRATEGYSGKALQDYQTIQASARANGFKVSDIIPGGFNEQQVLEGLATGRLDINRLEQDARKLAAQGQPQYVRDLLGQGYNLDQVYAPYRTTMANLLELNADQIDLNDPTLRMAITDKGDMNVYDFKKALKADNRWQYTENARNEVSTAAFNVLRDFGFQG
jgi:outer membrane murein-binding lipoprotein Lpp